MVSFLLNIRNIFDFNLRRHICLSRTDYKESGIDLPHVLCEFPNSDQDIITGIIEKYDFHRYLPYLKKLSLLDNLVHLLLLDRLEIASPIARASTSQGFEILDIGSKNFSYALAIREYFLRVLSQGADAADKAVRITGIELDANRMYNNFYSRKSCANYYVELCGDATYVAGDFMEHVFPAPFDVITNFYPFIFEPALLDWGLPRHFLQPSEMVEKIWRSLKPEGLYIMANVNRLEFEKASTLLTHRFILIADDHISSAITDNEAIYVSLFKKRSEA